MDETLESLPDKLANVKLKQWYSADDALRLQSVDVPEANLRGEIV
jgi:hypothetical protein